MAILEGKKVDGDKIDPALHKFIGMWRPPYPPDCSGAHAWVCSCGETIFVVGKEHEHWLKGCFDQAQYVYRMSKVFGKTYDYLASHLRWSRSKLSQKIAAFEEIFERYLGNLTEHEEHEEHD